MANDPMISALGRVVRIDASGLEPDDRAALDRAWAGALAQDAGDGADADAVVVARTDRALPQVLSSLSQQVTHAAITARRGELWMLHACAVADEEGRVVVLIGPSGRGKTTSARALARRYAYVTDETVGIDDRGIVHPYRKPLSIIETAGESKAQRAPGDLGLGALPDAPLRLAALVLLDRRTDGPDVPVIEGCDLGDALGELTEQSSHLAALPDALRTIQAHVGSVGGVCRVVYREADTLADALTPLFLDPEPIVEPRPLIDAPVDGAATGWRRAPYLDAIALTAPPRIALLQAGAHGCGMLRVLDGIGPVLWSRADGVPVAELVSAVIARHGEPEGQDAAAIVDDALRAMAAQSVLQGPSRDESRDARHAVPSGDHGM